VGLLSEELGTWYEAVNFPYAIPNIEIPEADKELMCMGDGCEVGLQVTKRKIATIRRGTIRSGFSQQEGTTLLPLRRNNIQRRGRNVCNWLVFKSETSDPRIGFHSLGISI
jgi:hypothetical protein